MGLVLYRSWLGAANVWLIFWNKETGKKLVRPGLPREDLTPTPRIRALNCCNQEQTMVTSLSQFNYLFQLQVDY